MIKIRPHLFETNSSSTDVYYDEWTDEEIIEEERCEYEIEILINIENKLIYNILDYANTSYWHGDFSGIFDDIFYELEMFNIDEDNRLVKTEINKDYTAFDITFDLLSSRTTAYTTYYEYAYDTKTEEKYNTEEFNYDFSKVDTKKLKEALLCSLFEYIFDDDYGGYDEFIEKYKNIDTKYLESLKNDWLNDKIDYDKIPLEIEI